MLSKSEKSVFSTGEAAVHLGLSVEQLQALVRNHMGVEEDLTEETRFQASDLVALRFLSSGLTRIALP